MCVCILFYLDRDNTFLFCFCRVKSSFLSNFVLGDHSSFCKEGINESCFTMILKERVMRWDEEGKKRVIESVFELTTWAITEMFLMWFCLFRTGANICTDSLFLKNLAKRRTTILRIGASSFTFHLIFYDCICWERRGVVVWVYKKSVENNEVDKELSDFSLNNHLSLSHH